MSETSGKDSGVAIDETEMATNTVPQKYTYGFGKWRPPYLQFLNNPIFLLICLCVVAILQGMVINGFVSISISTLEKRFGLTSVQTGILAAFYDIVIVIVVIPMSYFAARHNKIRIIAISIIMMAFGSILFAIPQFMSEPYEHTSSTEQVSNFCMLGDGNTDDCPIVKQTGSHIYAILMVAQAVHGVSCSTIFTITYIIIDENTSHKKSSIFTGIFYGFGVLGPALGYIAGGFLLKIHGDFYRSVLGPNFDSDNRYWYGAWWLGFVVAAVACLISSIPLFGFAPYLPDYERLKLERKSEAHQSTNDAHVQMSFGNKLSELPSSVLNLLKNPTYMLLVLGDSFDAFLLNGFIIFAPKYLETQFNITPSQASIFSGISLVPGGVIGTIVSGIIIRNMKVQNKIRFGAIMFLISIPLLFAFMMQCPQMPISGINSGYNMTQPAPYSLDNDCNNGCGCSVNYDQLICHEIPGTNSPIVAYASYCWAGCQGPNPTSKDCKCMPQGSKLLDNEKCKETRPHCPYFAPFLVCLFIIVFFTFMAATPTVQGIMRCVPFNQRSLAIGFGWMIARIVGTIPGPIVFGSIIDSACIVGSKCGNCIYYDTYYLMKVTLVFSIVLRMAAFVMFALAATFYKPSSNAVDSTDEHVSVELNGKEASLNGSTGDITEDNGVLRF